MIIYLSQFNPAKSLKKVYPEIIFAETTKTKDLSFLINEAFNEIYHNRVKDLPGRPMFSFSRAGSMRDT